MKPKNTNSTPKLQSSQPADQATGEEDRDRRSSLVWSAGYSCPKMAWPPLLSWIMYSSSSSSSSSEYETDDNNDIEDLEGNNHHDQPDNVQEEQKDHIDDDDNDDDDDDVSYEPEKEEEKDQHSDTTSDYSFTISEPPPKRRRIDHTNEALTSVQEENKKRCRKRVWSKEDELELLRGFLEYYNTKHVRTTIKETASFYDEIKPKLKLECSKAQMVQKLRRLKRKYHKVVNKMNDMNSAGKEFRIKIQHDKVIFEMSHKIWSTNDNTTRDQQHSNVQESNVVDSHEENNIKPHGLNDNGTTSSWNNNVDDNMNNIDLPGLIIGLATNPIPPSLSNFGKDGFDVGDEKWRQQQIMELGAYSKRLDLVQNQVKAALEELRSKGDE